MHLSNAIWRKASRSGENGGDCIEVAAVPGSVAVRDSKEPEGGALLLGRTSFRRFANAIKEL
ncbi:DUF397 domain-containing protein [Actinomadura parmotrematis]|uniref:DUF397 domain-containing protein n=1 Tax=Actinomadura parmotrematis TaxID=2864039 RepID=A0ABS7FUZ0_9ACTN|nr:DUF397 domain-containing protein [Actinomadura parmotrematis]MBW8484237.1 DUF397 domain-containing protein [Actinomadura parmotrematis]